MFASPAEAQADTFQNLDAFTSINGRLDIRLRAVQRKVAIDGNQVDALVYEACKINWSQRNATVDATSQTMQCSTNLYGGPRFKLKQGDVLRVQLVNDLPNLPNANAINDVEDPTNIHTHGLTVRPYAPTDRLGTDPANGSYGDFAFVTVMQQSRCGASGVHAHHGSLADMKCRVADYEIRIPGHVGESSMEQGEHPSGIFWLHPHFHTLAKEQVSGGMTAMLNIGALRDYACMKPRPDGTCNKNVPLPPMRHMLLKDIQLSTLALGAQPATALYDQYAGFCSNPAAANDRSYCLGGENDQGRWYFTINGVVHPTWSIDGGKAEVWRIQNASANVTYDLRLDGAGWDGQSGNGGMPFQILSLDGVGLGLINNGEAPGKSIYLPDALHRRAILMPGSRIEIVVAHRPRSNCPDDAVVPTLANCLTASTPADTSIALVNHEYRTGRDEGVGEPSDNWPNLELAKMTIRKSAMPAIAAVALTSNQATFGQTVAISGIPAGKTFSNSTTRELCRSGDLRALAPGERRRIYFGIAVDDGKSHTAKDPNWKPESFVLGHSVIDTSGVEHDPSTGNVLVDGPVLQTMNMRDAKSDLCIAYGAHERWELVNVSPEVHNFHIHQSRFKVVELPDHKGPAMGTPNKRDRLNLLQTVVNVGDDSKQVLHDTIIVPRGDSGCETSVGASGHFTKLDDGTIDDDNRYRLATGTTCRGNKAATDLAGWIDIRLDFNRPEQIGRYVFHCHILEHEDLGMMASIRILSPDQLSPDPIAKP
jgi:L-ascorbate oxidase